MQNEQKRNSETKGNNYKNTKMNNNEKRNKKKKRKKYKENVGSLITRKETRKRKERNIRKTWKA